ncbi:MAG: hypothetical protein ACOC2Q_04245 [Spirochaetota bacterium]
MMSGLRDRVAGLHLGRAIRLVWQSAPKLMVVSVFLVVLQAVIPLVPLMLVRRIVDAVSDRAEVGYLVGLVAVAGGATALSHALRPIAALVRQAQAERLSDFVQSIIHEMGRSSSTSCTVRRKKLPIARRWSSGSSWE